MKPLFVNITHTAPCADPGLPSNGKRDGSDFGHEKTVTFQCNDKYSLVGDESMSCNDGVWSAELPQCKGNSQCKNSKVFETKGLRYSSKTLLWTWKRFDIHVSNLFSYCF